MIVVYGGGRPSGTGEVFSRPHVDRVLEQLELMIAGLRPRLLVGSAAAGADLLVLSAAKKLTDKLRPTCHVITPGSQAAFRKASVDRWGPGWTERYNDLPGPPFVELNELVITPADTEFAAVNREIVRYARAKRRGDEPIVGIRVGPPPGDLGRGHDVDLRADLAADLGYGHLVLTVPTGLEAAPDAFVAMPFGTKEVPGRGWAKYRSDVSYERIFIPALIAAGFTPRRLDNDNLSEIIDRVMLRQLNKAKLVVGDLTAWNPNVFWELGIRHAWRPGGTSLVCLDGETLPFDLGRIPVSRFYRDEGDVSDADLVHSLETLVAAFRRAANPGTGTDSPVFAHLSGLTPVELPDVKSLPDIESKAAHDEDDLDRQIGWASQLRRVSTLRDRAGEVERNASLSEKVKGRLLGNIAYGLISCGKLDAAQELLAKLAEADPSNVVLQQYYAHTLIRGTEGDRDQELDEAKWRLEKLVRDQGPDPETCGLLGSARKVMAERALGRRDLETAVTHARAAVLAYEEGFKADVRAYYPGVNIVALSRLLGQRWAPNKKDLARAREILPVVRFVVLNALKRGGADLWVDVTAAELDLHELLLRKPATAVPPQKLADTFSELGDKIRDQDQARDSFCRQLRLMRMAEDPPDLIDDLLRQLGDTAGHK